MIKTSLIFIGVTTLGVGAAVPGTPASPYSPIESLEVQIAHLDIQKAPHGMKTKIANEPDYVLRIKLRNGAAINVRF